MVRMKYFIVCLFLFVWGLFFVGCSNVNPLDGLVLSKAGEDKIFIRPFTTDSGYMFVIPESWNDDSLQIRSTNGAFRVRQKGMT